MTSAKQNNFYIAFRQGIVEKPHILFHLDFATESIYAEFVYSV